MKRFKFLKLCRTESQRSKQRLISAPDNCAGWGGYIPAPVTEHICADRRYTIKNFLNRVSDRKTRAGRGIISAPDTGKEDSRRYGVKMKKGPL